MRKIWIVWIYTECILEHTSIFHYFIQLISNNITFFINYIQWNSLREFNLTIFILIYDKFNS